MTSAETWPQALRYFAEGLARALGTEVHTPSPAEFSAFINAGLCPFKSRLKAALRLNRLRIILGEIPTIDWPTDLLAGLDDAELLEHTPDGLLLFIDEISPDGILKGTSVDAEEEIKDSVLNLERARNQIPETARPVSFLVPLMEAWLTHPWALPTEPERRWHLILPNPIRHTVPARTKLAVPAGAELPQLGQQSTLPGYLPGLEPPPGVVVPVLPLQVAAVSTAGAGAPITSRLWFGCQMAFPLNRRTGEEVRLPFTLRDFCAWLWPNGWNRGRDMPRLREGLRNLSQLGVIWGRAEWLLVRPVNIPTHDTRLDDYLLVDVTALPGSNRGPMIDTRRLWALGAMGGIPWRIWLRLACVWDEVKARNGGHRIYATRPEVKRGDGEVILDRHGKPVLDRRRRPIRDWSDKRAVKTGRQERHPQAERVPLLDVRDQALLGFDNADVPAGTLRRRAKDTRSWLTKMEAMGIVALEYEGKEIRVLEIYPEMVVNGGHTQGPG